MWLSLIFWILLVVIMDGVIEMAREKQWMKKMNRYLHQKNEKYYDELFKRYEKNQKMKMKKRMHYGDRMSILLERCGCRNNLFFHPISFLVWGVICVVIAYHVAVYFLGIILLSLFISAPFFFLPYVLLTIWAEQKEKKMEKEFLHFLLQLKNHTQIHNDIVMAMKEVKVNEPLNGYVKQFLIEVGSGIRIEQAISNWRRKMSITQIQTFLTNVEHCYLYGGSFPELMEKSYHIMKEVQEEKTRRQEETKGARMVLILLIALDFLVYFSFIQTDIENATIMKNSFIGNLILYWNFGSMWLLVLLANRVKKLDY